MRRELQLEKKEKQAHTNWVNGLNLGPFDLVSCCIQVLLGIGIFLSVTLVSHLLLKTWSNSIFCLSFVMVLFSNYLYGSHLIYTIVTETHVDEATSNANQSGFRAEIQPVFGLWNRNRGVYKHLVQYSVLTTNKWQEAPKSGSFGDLLLVPWAWFYSFRWYDFKKSQ